MWLNVMLIYFQTKFPVTRYQIILLKARLVLKDFLTRIFGNLNLMIFLTIRSYSKFFNTKNGKIVQALKYSGN